MANILYANNAAGTLSAGITNVATALTLGAGQGALFPNPSAPQVFYVTLTDAATQTLIEIVQVTARAGDVFSIVRAQDGTSALSWNAGDIVSLRTIRLELQGFENAAEGLFGVTGQNVKITPSTTLGIAGTTLADNANAGSVGEFQTATALNNSLLSATPGNVVGILLQPGDWDVSVTATVKPTAGQTVSVVQVSAGTISATLGGLGAVTTNQWNGFAGDSQTITSPPVRISQSVATQVWGVVNVVFSGGVACLGDGFIRARRIR